MSDDITPDGIKAIRERAEHALDREYAHDKCNEHRAGILEERLVPKLARDTLALCAEVERLTRALRDEAKCIECGRHPIEHSGECHGIMVRAGSAAAQEEIARLTRERDDAIEALRPFAAKIDRGTVRECWAPVTDAGRELVARIVAARDKEGT